MLSWSFGKRKKLVVEQAYLFALRQVVKKPLYMAVLLRKPIGSDGDWPTRSSTKVTFIPHGIGFRKDVFPIQAPFSHPHPPQYPIQEGRFPCPSSAMSRSYPTISGSGRPFSLLKEGKNVVPTPSYPSLTSRFPMTVLVSGRKDRGTSSTAQ